MSHILWTLHQYDYIWTALDICHGSHISSSRWTLHTIFNLIFGYIIQMTLEYFLPFFLLAHTQLKIFIGKVKKKLVGTRLPSQVTQGLVPCWKITSLHHSGKSKILLVNARLLLIRALLPGRDLSLGGPVDLTVVDMIRNWELWACWRETGVLSCKSSKSFNCTTVDKEMSQSCIMISGSMILSTHATKPQKHYKFSKVDNNIFFQLINVMGRPTWRRKRNLKNTKMRNHDRDIRKDI